MNIDDKGVQSATQCSTTMSVLGPKEKENDISRAAFSQLDIPAAGKNTVYCLKSK